ncbi:MAG: hypothetical protein EXR73_08705 [Myxococcales bacterium]|nr:hypothetical protein [Myxococcales bacterium]
MTRCAVGVSLSPERAAAREAVASAVARLGEPATGLVLFVSRAHGDPRALLAAARREAPTAMLAGCTVSGVLTGEAEVEDGPGVVAMAFAGAYPIRSFALGDPNVALPPLADEQATGLAILLADGYSAHPEQLAQQLARGLPARMPLVGALASAVKGHKPAHRFVDDALVTSGGVGLVVAGAEGALVGVAGGCMAIGPAHRVTAAKGTIVETLNDQPAFAVFAEAARPLLHDLATAAQTVFLGEEIEGGRIIRGITGFDPERGLLASTEPIAEGATLRFLVRDARAAREELRTVATRIAKQLGGRPPRWGLYLASAARGRALYGLDDHDVSILQGTLGTFPLAGAFVGGELAAVGGTMRLQVFSGVLAVAP